MSRDNEEGSGAMQPSPGGYAVARRKHPSLLVVDDDPGVREAVASVLRDERYIVATAGNGNGALELMRSGFRPAAVLLDVWMPELDGEQTLAAMKADPELAGIPVIIITAALDPKIVRSVSLSANQVMRKPLDLEELLFVVEQHVGAPGL